MRWRAGSVRPHLVHRNAAQKRISWRWRMTMAVKAVPEGYHTVTPRLFVKDAAKLIDFLKHAFGASGTFRDDGPTDVRIGDSIVMVSGTDFREATESFFYLYLEDTDEAYRRAIAAGATSLDAPQDMFYGD